jgi:hypothetical protein
LVVMGKEGRQIGSQGTFSNATLLARHQNFDCAHVAVLFERGRETIEQYWEIGKYFDYIGVI